MSESERSGRDVPAAGADLLKVTAAQVGSAAVVTVVGELDLQTARELMAVVDEVLGRPGLTGLVVDLTEVSFLGSSGLGTLAELATRTARPAGSAPYAPPQTSQPPLRIVAPPHNKAVIRPWETMNLQQILPLHPDVGAALQSL